MAKKKKSREKSKVDLLVPVEDILKIGSEDDPCWGTHDPTDEVCKICGDSELCSIVKSQTLHTRRKAEETVKFKDVARDEAKAEGDKKIKKKAKKLIKKGVEKPHKALMEKFGLNKKDAKNFIKSVK